MGKATERLFLPLIRLFLPEITDINMPAEGVFHNLVVVSIKKRFPGHARKVIFGLWGLALLSLSKAIVVVMSGWMCMTYRRLPGRRWGMLIGQPTPSSPKDLWTTLTTHLTSIHLWENWHRRHSQAGRGRLHAHLARCRPHGPEIRRRVDEIWPL